MGNSSRHNTVMAHVRGGEQFRRALTTDCVRLGFPRRTQSPETASARVAPDALGLGLCRAGYAPPVHMIKLTQERDIAPYVWVHPDGDW